jgi:hypothetical protein
MVPKPWQLPSEYEVIYNGLQCWTAKNRVFLNFFASAVFVSRLELRNGNHTMDSNIFAKNNERSVGEFLGMAAGLSMGFFVGGNFISLCLLAVAGFIGVEFDEYAFLVTVPIGCAVMAAALAIGERKKTERAANLKVYMMMRTLKSYDKLTDDEIEAFYEGMRDLELGDMRSGEPAYGRGYGE